MLCYSERSSPSANLAKGSCCCSSLCCFPLENCSVLQGGSILAGDAPTQPIEASIGQDASLCHTSQEAVTSATGPRPSTSPAYTSGYRSRAWESPSHRAGHVDLSRSASRGKISGRSCSTSCSGSGRGAGVENKGRGSHTARSMPRFPRHESPKPPPAATFRPATADSCTTSSRGRRAASVGTYLPRPHSVLGSVRPQTNCGRYLGRIQNKSLRKLHCDGDGGKGADVLRAATSITIDQRHELV